VFAGFFIMHVTDVRVTSRQFTLRSLFELITLCGVIAAFQSSLGIAPAASLMLLALSLHFRLSSFALICLMAAFVTAPLSRTINPDMAFLRQLKIPLAASLISAWYWRRAAAQTQTVC